MKVRFSRCNSSGLTNVPVIDGQMVYVKDTHDMYMDAGTTRTKVSDIIFLSSLEERDAIETPIVAKIYFVLENLSLYIHNGTTWVTVAGNAASTQFDNSGTGLQATTVQDAIIELCNKIGDISTALDTINGEVV